MPTTTKLTTTEVVVVRRLASGGADYVGGFVVRVLKRLNEVNEVVECGVDAGGLVDAVFNSTRSSS